MILQSALIAVHLFLISDKKILLLRRFNTGFGDGQYSVPAGHVEQYESAVSAIIRETNEEIGIDIKNDTLRVVQLMHRKGIDSERIDYFFVVNKWMGEIINNEPHKCDKLKWYNINNLPDNMLDYVDTAINNFLKGVTFSFFGW